MCDEIGFVFHDRTLIVGKPGLDVSDVALGSGR